MPNVVIEEWGPAPVDSGILHTMRRVTGRDGLDQHHDFWTTWGTGRKLPNVGETCDISFHRGHVAITVEPERSDGPEHYILDSFTCHPSFKVSLTPYPASILSDVSVASWTSDIAPPASYHGPSMRRIVIVDRLGTTTDLWVEWWGDDNRLPPMGQICRIEYTTDHSGSVRPVNTFIRFDRKVAARFSCAAN